MRKKPFLQFSLSMILNLLTTDYRVAPPVTRVTDNNFIEFLSF